MAGTWKCPWCGNELPITAVGLIELHIISGLESCRANSKSTLDDRNPLADQRTVYL